MSRGRDYRKVRRQARYEALMMIAVVLAAGSCLCLLPAVVLRYGIAAGVLVCCGIIWREQ